MTFLELAASVGIPIIIWKDDMNTVDLAVESFGCSKRQAREWLKQGALKTQHYEDCMALRKGTTDVVVVVKGKYVKS